MRMAVCLFAVQLFAANSLAQDTWKDVYSEKAWTDRDRWQRAPDLIRQLNIHAGSRVADIGCHEGYMTIKLSPVVGDTGTVYAVDIESAKLERLKKHLVGRNLHNVNPILGDADNPHLPVASLDAVLILDTYHEIDEHDKVLAHIMTALKPGGRLVLCEAIADSRRKSSREDQERRHELGLNFALADVRKAGFHLVYQADPFVDRTAEKGDKMWILVVKK